VTNSQVYFAAAFVMKKKVLKHLQPPIVHSFYGAMSKKRHSLVAKIKTER
jgi:hypothetical protein